MSSDDNVIVLAERRLQPANDEPEEVVGEFTVYSSGRMTVWVSDINETPAQFNWLLGCLIGIGAAILDLKHKRTDTR